jgi:tetratricopeptide (TPR) repeat protein
MKRQKTMLANFIKRYLIVSIGLAVFLTGCATNDFNTGRGAWNAPEYVYQPKHIKRKFIKALNLMEAGKDEKATLAFEKFIAEHPNYPGAYVNLAILYERNERTDDALSQLYIALEIIPDYPYALNQLGLIYRQQGKFTAAESVWLRATREAPEYPNPWYNLGVLYDLYIQDMSAALVAYERYQLVITSPAETPEEAELLADAEAARWIVDLRRRIGPAHAATGGDSL